MIGVLCVPIGIASFFAVGDQLGRQLGLGRQQRGIELKVDAGEQQTGDPQAAEQPNDPAVHQDQIASLQLVAQNFEIGTQHLLQRKDAHQQMRIQHNQP